MSAIAKTKVACLLAAVILVLFWRGMLVSSGGALPPASGLLATINEKTAELHLKVRTTELPTEKAERVRDAIKSGDYASAYEITAQVLAKSRLQDWGFYPFENFIEAVADVTDPDFGARLDAWVSAQANDAIPILIRARYFYDLGWFTRGHSYNAYTLPAHLTSFQATMKKALDDIDRAIGLDDGNPYSQYLKVLILRGQGTTDALSKAFEAAIAKYPAYYNIYDVALSVLQPKWGGNIPAMYAFVARYAGGAPADSPRKLLYVSFYRYLLSAASTGCLSSHSDNDKLATCVESVMQRTAPAALDDEVLAALQSHNRWDKYGFGLAITNILHDVQITRGAQAYAGVLLQIAASAMHSDTKLETQGYASYVIDLAVADSWYQKGFFDNALKKSRDALRDVDQEHFSNDEDRYLSEAKIYEYIAGIYNATKQFENEIVYENAAVAIGHLTAYQSMNCHAFYELKAYEEALGACTKAIRDQPSDMPSRYWRGVTYRELSRTDEALRDLTDVAGSEFSVRTSAVLGISMIHFKKKDVRAALDILNRYQFIYDPNMSSKADVAVSYNNRCYAYMQLGELNEALKDCTASLKFGNLPDAYSKQQELLQRLKAGETRL
jgi:tetratricopeptide (TPR) repeat protein